MICETHKIISAFLGDFFDHFYPISPEIFAIVQNFPILHFRDPLYIDRLGKYITPENMVKSYIKFVGS